MSVLIFLDQADGHIRKSSLEAACYGAKVAEQLGVSAEGITVGTITDDLPALGQYGLKKVYTLNQSQLNNLDAQVYTQLIADLAIATQANVIIFSNNLTGKAVAPRLSVRLKAGLVAGAVACPDTTSDFTVKKNVFSGKAFAHVSINTATKIITLNPNSFSITTGDGVAEVVEFAASHAQPKVEVTAVNKVVGEVPLTEAEIVVSCGRG